MDNKLGEKSLVRHSSWKIIKSLTQNDGWEQKTLTMSVPKSMHKIVTVPNGKGISHKMKAKKGEISGIFDVSVYAIDFFKLSKIKRPSSTPVTIDAKLSSNKIMSAA